MMSITSSLSVGIHCVLLGLLAESSEFYSKFPLESEISTDNSTYATAVYAIAGGKPTLQGEFPFMAALGWLNKFGVPEYHCGGMLITSKMVLTAAHCVYLDGKIPDIVHLGGGSLKDGGQYFEYLVLKATIFPQYTSNQAYYDIAILELADNTKVSPVCLWTNPNMHMENATAIGYGVTAFAGQNSQSLLKVNLTVYSEMYCQQFFKRQRKFKQGLSQAHICAGDSNGQKDTCQGDSGGPLIAYYGKRQYAIGITSTGQACSGVPPAIYTKIASYIKWITEVIGEGNTMLKDCP